MGDIARTGGGRSFQTIMEDMRQSSLSLQKPADLIILLGYSVTLYGALRVCIEAGVFRVLAASQSPLPAHELSEKLNGVPEDDTEDNKAEREEFIARMCRAVSGMGLIDEVAAATYQGNEITRALAEPGFDLGMRELLDTALGPDSTLSHMTYWGKEHAWKAPQRATDAPFQRARGIVGTTTFEHFVKTEPHLLSWLSALMKVIQRDRLNWSAWFPADALLEAGNGNGQVPLMVDVGGGLGHDLTALAQRYPAEKMKLVLEDLPSVIAETKEEKLDPRIALVEHDFFTTQPIHGAKIVGRYPAIATSLAELTAACSNQYFMHKIMHDWPDYECIQILGHLRDAMAADSRIFINDCIVPETGSPLQFSAFDLTMFIQLGAKERSETMWTRLISKVGGLRIKKFWQAPELKGEGIVEVVKA